MRRVLLVAVTVATFGCGGRSEQSCPDCPPPRTRLSSAEATIAIVNELPEDALLLLLSADPSGTLNHDGLDLGWTGVARSTSGESAWFADVELEDGEPLVTLTEREPFDCAGPPLHEVDSAVAVPAAVSRVNALTEVRSIEAVLVNYWQEAPCIAEMSNYAPTGHLVRVNRRGSDWQVFFFAHFDDSARLVSLCGPCESGLLENCETCSP